MVDFDPGINSFSPKNALLLANLCLAAYEDEPGARSAVNALGLPGFIWIDLTKQFEDVYAIAASGPGFLALAFRGTKDLYNWMTDLHATPVSFPWIFESGPDVSAIHAGFGNALRDAWEKISAALTSLVPPPDLAPETPQPTFWITGHSLGGALAVLAGAAFSMWAKAPLRPVNGIYTFGQPRVGLYQFCGNYDLSLEKRTFRFVNNKDLVPRVPFRGFDYADLGQMIHFNADGKPQLQSLEWSNFLSRTLQSFADFFDIAGHIAPDVADHSMSGYADLVQAQAANLAALTFAS